MIVHFRPLLPECETLASSAPQMCYVVTLHIIRINNTNYYYYYDRLIGLVVSMSDY